MHLSTILVLQFDISVLLISLWQSLKTKQYRTLISAQKWPDVTDVGCREWKGTSSTTICCFFRKQCVRGRQAILHLGCSTRPRTERQACQIICLLLPVWQCRRHAPRCFRHHEFWHSEHKSLSYTLLALYISDLQKIKHVKYIYIESKAFA